MNDILKGLLLGCVIGVIDLIPMMLQGLTLDANLSAFSMWVVIGFLISTSTLKINSVLKGILISFLVLLPNTFIIGWSQPLSLIPVIIMTLILGSIMGYVLRKKQ